MELTNEALSAELYLANTECHALRQENEYLARLVTKPEEHKPLRAIAAERITRNFRAAKLIAIVLGEAMKSKLPRLPRIHVEW